MVIDIQMSGNREYLKKDNVLMGFNSHHGKHRKIP